MASRIGSGPRFSSAGTTAADDFAGITPATAVQPSAAGVYDYFLCRLDLDAPSPLLYGTYLGGSDGDGVRYWCSDSAVWSNGGDTVILQDPLGNVVARWVYAAGA